MARRAAAARDASEDPASPEPQPRQTRVKAEKEKVKEEKDRVRVKDEGKGKGKGRARVEDEDEGKGEGEGEEGGRATPAQSQSQSHEEEEEQSPRGSKRRRVNGNGNGSGHRAQVHDEEDGEQDEDQEQDEDAENIPRAVKTLPRGADGYIPGSITRIQLHNFVTYDFVEFRPGPFLNMIVGPNGTGKSSIACAIAIGLNFPPSILGRATDLNAFVKNSTKEGYIEIELKGPAGHPNLVIRRKLSAESKQSSFTLNGQPATGAEIKSKVGRLGVQVGNLCSFLPQDRVSEFAAMSPQQLLRETQRAAGDENLTKWHDTLIGAGKELRGVQQTIKDEEVALNQMKERNEGIERDVQRFHERKKIEHAIALLTVLIPVAEYRESREKFVAVKARQRVLHAKVQRLKERNGPAHEMLKQLDTEYKRADAERDQLKKSSQAKFRKLFDKAKASDKLEEITVKLQDELTNLRESEKNRREHIEALKNDIKKLKAEVAKPPPDGLGSEEEVAEENRKIRLERQGLESELAEVDSQRKYLITKRTEAEQTLKRAEAELAREQSADTQKLNRMERWDVATFRAIQWVRANKHLFRMEVFETPFMRVTVKDQRFVAAVEACFGAAQMKAFVCQCAEDADTLNKHINDDRVLGQDMRITVWYRAQNPNHLLPEPMNREEMHQLGFDGYALDYLEFPEGMRWFLTHNVNLHRTAISLRGVDIARATEAVGRPKDRHPGGAAFVSRDTMNVVSRSRYGMKALTNMTRDITPPRNLTVPTIDPERKARIDQDIQEARMKIEQIEHDLVPIRNKLKELAERDSVFEERYTANQKKKDAIKNEAKRRQSAKTKLDSKQRALHAEQNKPPVDEQRKKIKKLLMANAEQRLIYAKEYTDLVHAIIVEQERCTKVGLKCLQIAANREYLQELCDRKDQKYNEALAEFTKVNDEFQRIKAESKEILQRSRDTVAAAPDDVKEEYTALESARMEWEKEAKEAKEQGLPPPDDAHIDQRRVEELEAELEQQQAELEMNLGTNPGVVEQYEKRKRDIEVLERTLEERRKKEAKIEKDIKNARDNWHPALQKLVNSIGEKFSAAFDRIGCAGEIRIREDEDYEKWAIDILVKFRDSERLQLLTAHRQSGGERSLTTILYLMSLTEEARAPFSLVDEINQGMDQRAERVVHNSMVNVTCQPDSAQYFLITPKLLPDLQYHERMKVLCVNNGEWLPEIRGMGNMMDMIDGYEAARGLKGKKGGRADI